MHRDCRYMKKKTARVCCVVVYSLPPWVTGSLFNPDPAEYTSNLDLNINNTARPMATHPKVLGLTLDPKLTYSTHIHNISVQAHTSLQIINALTATGWGKQETLMATYKVDMRLALEYASSIWCVVYPFPCLLLVGGGGAELPACGPPARLSAHLASSAVTPAGSVHKSRGDNVVRM